jgi:epoxyqueuosine reductase QueG
MGGEDAAIKNFQINRRLLNGKHKLSEVFSGLKYSPAIRELFCEDLDLERLRRIDVEITDDATYMRVSEPDGGLLVNPHYLRKGRKEFIYLDLVHELTHIKQYWSGRELYDPRCRYIDRPTELEAFTRAVTEAKRISLSEPEIYEYLKVDWISDSEHKELAERLGITPPARAGRHRRVAGRLT